MCALATRMVIACLMAGVTFADGPPVDAFAFPLRDLIHNEADLGIANGKASVGVNYRHLADVWGFFAPPLVSSDFRFTIALDGNPLSSNGPDDRWFPNGVYSASSQDGLSISSGALLPYGERALIVSLTFSSADRDRDVALSGSVSGTLDVNRVWEFARPKSEAKTTPERVSDVLLLTQGEHAIAIAAEPAVDWNTDTLTWRRNIQMAGERSHTQRFVIAVGARQDAIDTCRRLIREGDFDNLGLKKRCSEYLPKLPRFECDNKALERLYYRSLVHGLLNRWDVPEFKLNPYYSTGSVNGGCLCNYLWNFGEVWEILPMIDPEATKAHIKHFLGVDLTRHFAFLPVTGEGFGPWYMVNQEKIIGLVYYYVMITGDTAFLGDSVNGRSILDHMIEHATYGDDPAKSVALIDYGESNSHLELRKDLKYNRVMPDLNGRRYNNYVFAAKLSEIMGKPRPELIERADALKKVLHDELWDPQTKWFAFKNGSGEKELRYTCQMFKLFNSPVLTDESLSGLLSHWNTNEFLGDYGLHSLAKGDRAYDENDVDNGGPGACACFPPQIMERLYKSGHTAEADEMLKRILWWGEKLPYWGDSLYADRPDYRKDTPLQCTLDGLTAAQMIIFGLFGVTPSADGSISIHPHLPPIARDMSLRDVRLRGQTFTVIADTAGVQIQHGEETKRIAHGETHLLRPAN